MHDVSIIDITRPIRAGMPVWPGDPEVCLSPVLSISAGDGATVSRLTLGTHTGTHIDAPSHLLQAGSTADQTDLAALVGPCLVVDVGSDDLVEGDDLGPDALSAQRLLLKGSAREVGAEAPDPAYQALSPDAARLLVGAGVLLVGTEVPSVDPVDSADLPAHRLLLDAGIVIVEGLDLSAVIPGQYQLVCLPLPIVGADGAPARTILLAQTWPAERLKSK